MAIDKEAVKQAIQDTFIYDNMVKEMAKEEGVDLEGMLMSSNRTRMWNIFSEEVASHIENYTVKQYGDFPNDQATGWDELYLKQCMQKYINRMESNERGDMERDRDLFKIAHYCQMIWSKRLGFDAAFKEVLLEQEAEAVASEPTAEEPCEKAGE